jgi:hypothetical protein
VTVELQRFKLIVEAHQTLVTRGLALRFEIVPLFIKVTASERLAGNARKGIGFPSTNLRNTPAPPSVASYNKMARCASAPIRSAASSASSTWKVCSPSHVAKRTASRFELRIVPQLWAGKTYE